MIYPEKIENFLCQQAKENPADLISRGLPVPDNAEIYQGIKVGGTHYANMVAISKDEHGISNVYIYRIAEGMIGSECLPWTACMLEAAHRWLDEKGVPEDKRNVELFKIARRVFYRRKMDQVHFCTVRYSLSSGLVFEM